MKNIAKIIQLSKPLHGFILLAGIFIVIKAALDQATPIALKYVVDELTKQVSEGAGSYQTLLWLFALILLVNFLGVLLNSISQRLGDFIASRLGKHLSEEYYHKIFTLPQKYFDSELSGKMVNQLNRGILSIRDFVGSATNFILPALLQAAFGIGILTYFDPVIGLLAFSVFPVYIAISSYSTRRWGALQAEKNVYEDSIRGRIQEVISNIKLVKTYTTQKREWEHLSQTYGKINKIYDKQSTLYHVLNFIRESGLEIAFIGILFLIFRKTFLGEMSLGEMVLIIQLLNQLRWPLYGMSYILEKIQQSNADAGAFFDVLDLPEEEHAPTKAAKNLLNSPEVRFDHVGFSYEDSTTPVLKDVSFTLKKNQTVALVGNSGAGKTTLINLILKLYEPTSGEIYLSDKKYSGADHGWIRSHMALVFQENELFSSTIRENVIYGMPNATDEQVIDALKKANAYEFVSRYPKGIHAEIGERGVRLSGGQKQRLQIARAILHDKPILILDEATSSLDSKSEKLVQEALEKLFKNRLVLIIAHRFSTIQNADQILVLDHGDIVDTGTPAQLAKKPGLYSELLGYQVAGNKKLLQKYDLF